MHRIDHPTAVGGLFTEGGPSQAATVVTADWSNAIQEEVAGVVEAAGLTLSKPDNTQLLQALNLLYGAGGGGFSNAIQNGDFDLWQRKFSGAVILNNGTGPGYTADRWRMNPGTGGTPEVEVSRAQHTVGQTDVPGEPQHLLNLDQTAAATTANPTLEQRIENVRTFAGIEITYSFYAKCTSATVAVTPNLVQNFGTGGSAAVPTVGTLHTITTSWQRFTATVTLPSISGKTLGIDASGNSDHFLALELPFPQSSTYEVQISRVQVEAGSNVSAFEARPFEVEIGLCKRYYEKSLPLNTNPGSTSVGGYSTGEGAGTNAFVLQTKFEVEKRTVPTVTWYDPGNAAQDQILWESASRAVTGDFARQTTTTGWPTVGSSRANSQYSGHWVADAEL